MESIIQYLPSILSVAGIMIIAIISPGPNFAVIVKNSLVYSRRTALLTALGIAMSTLIHIAYILFGLSAITSPSFLLIIKFLGASYLIYIGYKSIRAKKMNLKLGDNKQTQDISAFSAFFSGFLTNAFNPKCILFFVSLFSVIIESGTPNLIIFIYGAIDFVTTLCWFSFVALCLTDKRVREKFSSMSHIIERITGGILITLGIKLFLTKI